MNSSVIKIGFCVSYDWELLKNSVPFVYQHADIICFSIDKYRKTWNGVPYHFDEHAFSSWKSEIDVHHKIIMCEEVFSDTSRTAMQNDNLQRNSMAAALGKGGWHIQIDADEYFLDFKKFKEYLLKMNKNPKGNEKPINITCSLLPVFKKLDDGFLIVINDQNYEVFPVATNCPSYQYARVNGHFNHDTPFFIVHETWARGEKQLWEKINNWGHRDDFNVASFFNLWKALDKYNYIYLKNFNPTNRTTWQNLAYVKANNIEQLIHALTKNYVKIPSKWHFFLKNFRFFQSIKQRLG